MRTDFQRHIFLLLFFVLSGVFAATVSAQTLTGDWKADLDSEKPDKIHVSFSRRSSDGKGHNNMGSNYSFNDFQGLTREQVSSNEARVNFRLVREAGTIDCEGIFRNGKGSGTFRFTADSNFTSAMRRRGFEFNDEKLFAATTLDLTTAFVDDLKTANFPNLDVDDLFKARIFNVTPQFMREMAATGFPNMGMEDLVKARIFKIDAGYVREVRAMGFRADDMETLTKLRIFKVTPEFIREVQNEGLKNLTAEDLVKLRIFKVDGEFIRRAKAQNVNLSVEDLVEMRIGVRRFR